MATCTVCLGNPLESDWEQQMKLCMRCADAYGVMPMRPPRRPPRPCAACNSMHFIRAIPRELTASRRGAEVDRVASPMAVTYQHEYQTGPIAGPLAIDSRKTYGFLEMYICRKCGLVEWYCNDPENIPLGPQFMTEDVSYEGEGPYR
jgi:hypothetical protein